MNARLAMLLSVVLSGCSVQAIIEAIEGAPPLDLSDEPLAVPATIERAIPLKAVLPTDLQPLPAGGFVVLDGVDRRLLLFDDRGDPTGVIAGNSTWGRPVRVLPDGDGFWLSDPGDEDEPGGLIRVNAAGEAVDYLSAVAAPVAFARRGDVLVVSQRDGSVRALDPSDPDATHDAGFASSDARPGIADLVTLADGSIAAVDSLAPGIEIVPPSGPPTAFGRFGHYVGALRQPKSATAGPNGTLLVADSALGVLQWFSGSGKALGVVQTDGPLVLDHPTAIRALGAGRYAALAAGEPAVYLLAIADADVLAEVSTGAQLRTPLDGPSTADASGCLHCHDGFVRDSRTNWDPRLEHHPVDFVPERELPDSFESTGDRMTCGTCHAPHGQVTLAESRQGMADEIAPRVRHEPAGNGFLRVSPENSALCLACHADAAHGGLTDAAELIGGSGHLVGAALRDALARRPGADKQPTRSECLGCHAVHGAGSEPLLRASDAGASCLGCHNDRAQTSRNHPLGRAFGADTPRPGASARLVLGPDAGIGCTTCHDPKAGEGDALLRKKGVALCLSCHASRKGLPGGPHGKVKGRQGIPCLGCHDVHGASRAAHLTTVGKGDDTQGCVGCHGPGGAHRKNNPGTAGHPTADAGSGDRRIEGCETCHDVHAPAPPTTECASCHDEQGAAAARGGHAGASCQSCHPPHSNVPPPPASASGANPASRRCLTCHAPDGRGSELRIAAWTHPDTAFLPDGSRWKPLGKVPLFDRSGQRVAPGQNGALACNSCHATHGPVAGVGEDKLRLPDWKKACSACHGADGLALYQWFHQPKRREEVVGP